MLPTKFVYLQRPPTSFMALIMCLESFTERLITMAEGWASGEAANGAEAITLAHTLSSGTKKLSCL